jgi:hypothetical protein
MSNLSDLMKDIFHEQNDAITKAGDILGTLADLSGAVGSVQLGISVVESIVGQDDQLQDMFNAIMNEFQQVNQMLRTEEKLARMRDVDNGINSAVGVFQQLPAMLIEPHLSAEYKLGQVQICLDSLNFFSNYDDKWQTVYQEFPYYTDGWSGSLAPPVPSDGLVFNYTYTLPQFLRALYIFLAVVNGLAPSSLPTYAPALSQAAARLLSIHDTIVTGIVPTRLPGIWDVGGVEYPYSRAQQYISSWYESNQDLPWSYGAVELYSGANNVDSYLARVSSLMPSSNCLLDLMSYALADRQHPNYIPMGQFVSLLKLRIAMARKHLYQQIGGLTLRRTINRLRQLTGQSLLGGDSYDICRPAEAGAILGIDLSPRGIDVLQIWSGIVSTLSDWLKATPPYCGGRMWCGSSFEVGKLFEFKGPPVPGQDAIIAEVLGDPGADWPRPPTFTSGPALLE